MIVTDFLVQSLRISLCKILGFSLCVTSVKDRKLEAEAI